MLTVEDLKDLKGKKVYVRVDFNVPQKNGVIRDDNRIQAALPTLEYLADHGARLVVMSHLGKIKWKEPDPAKIEEMKKANNLECAAKRLAELMPEHKVSFCPENRGAALKAAVDALQDGDILVAQNTRYQKGEEKNDPELAKEWASLVDIFVMDAFGSAHRAHASTVGVPSILKAEGKPVALGYLMLKEVKNLTRCVEVKDSDRPYVAILGGFKVSDKIKVIDSLLKKCDKILIGGGMSYTFKAAIFGINVQNSICEPDQFDYVKKCYETGKIMLSVDTVVGKGFNPDDPYAKVEDSKVVEGNEDFPEGYEGLDIGPKTRELYAAEIAKAKTVFWNGPMGAFENPDFQAGTKAVCEAVAEATGKGAFTVIGGGDSAAAAKQFGYADKFSHISTGGGASLELIQYDGHLPGIDVIAEGK